MSKKHLTDISNVLVIGIGGAVLRAAIEVKKLGLKVHILGKRSKNDAHTVLAAGGINAPFGNVDKNDSWEQHFADTFIEGYGIGDPKIVEIMTKGSIEAVKEINSWGANFEKLENGDFNQRYFGAHTYRRTCFSGDYTGQSIIKALLKKSKSLNIPIFDTKYVTELLVKDQTCFGAMTIDKYSGERVVHLADAVIICTGGHTKLWKNSSSRKNENTGDGLYLALKAGCELKDMEMVQFHPTGMVIPREMAGTLVTEAVRGEGGLLLNIHGERFMKKYDPERMELSTRDKVAIANYTEIIEGRSTPNGGVYLDISHKSKDFLIQKIPKIYRQFIETQLLDISKEPMEVSPTAHYSMGGIVVTPEEHSTNICGLYAAGEVAAGLHGANRLGGNSLAEILVFGKKVGLAAGYHSIKIKSQLRSNQIINMAHSNIDRVIKKGSELSIPLQDKIGKIMWECCGVIKDHEKLKKGFNEICIIEDSLNKIDVRIEDGNYDDLINLFELKSSVISSKVTLLSAIERKESRGAHQRSDYPKLSSSKNFNIFTKLMKNKISIYKKESPEIDNNLKNIIMKTNKIENLKNRLLE